MLFLLLDSIYQDHFNEKNDDSKNTTEYNPTSSKFYIITSHIFIKEEIYLKRIKNIIFI